MKHSYLRPIVACVMVLLWIGGVDLLALAPGLGILGMAGADTQQIDGIYKDYYEDFVADQTNNKNPLSDLLKPEKVDFAGREVVYSADVTRNTSPMWVGEDGAFADAGAQGNVQVRIGQRKLMARVRLTSEAIHDSQSSKGAFKAARTNEMNKIIKDIARMEEAALTLDGRGVLAHVAEATPTTDTSLTLDNPGGLTQTSFGNRFIRPGMFIGFVNPATGVLRSGIRKVTACASTGGTVTLDAAPAAGVADNDYVVQAANSSVTDVVDTSWEKAAWGMMALVDDGNIRNNYFNVDRSVYGAYQSYVKASTGTLSEDLLQQVSDVLDQKLGSKITRILAHHSTRRLYLKLSQPDRRYSIQSMHQNPDVMTKAFRQMDVTAGEAPVTPIRDFPLDVMMLIDEENSGFVRYQASPGEWVQEDGSVLVRVGTGSSGRDSFEAWYRKRYQNHCRYPGYSARLDGITGQSLIVVRAE
jgi:hypothetical protein